MEHYQSFSPNLAPPQWIQSKLLQRKQCTPYEQRKLTEAVSYFSRLSIEDIRQCLLNKSVDSFIESIPYSLSLLETIYSKFYLYDKHEFPTNLLKPEKLLARLIAHFAQEYCRLNSEPKKLAASGHHQYVDEWITMEPRAKNLLKTICDCCPQLMHQMKTEKRRLDTALEGLGLHGLVNFGDRTLIDLPEAVKQELQDHQHRVKAFFQKVDKTISKSTKELVNTNGVSHCVYSINGGRGPVPVKSSHQRLMSMRMSDVKNRLQRNEHLLQLIKNSLTNVDLENLSRILQKRVNYDDSLLNEMNVLLKSPSGCLVLPFLTGGPGQMRDDPVASQVLVVFCKAYEKLLLLLPNVKADDSGLGDEEDNALLSDSNTATTSTKAPDSSRFGSLSESVYSQQHGGSNCSKSSNELFTVNNRAKKPGQRFNFYQKTPSLSNVNCADRFESRHELYTCKSSQHLAGAKSPLLPPAPPLPLGAGFRSFDHLEAPDLYQSKHNMAYRLNNFRSPSEENNVTAYNDNYHWMKSEFNKCKLENERLKRELTSAISRPDSSTYTSIYESNAQINGHSNKADNRQLDLLDRYITLYNRERVEAMHELKQLNELERSEELQWKILLSVIVLSFRAVQTEVNQRLEELFKVMNLVENPNDSNLPETLIEFRESFGRVLVYKSGQNGHAKTIKAVSEQIWQTLFDYPSLKVCKKFNCFIKTCVQLAWDATCGNKRFAIDYEGSEFSPVKHNRLKMSNFKSKTIKRFVWPALYEESSRKYVYRAVVVT